MVLYLNYYFDLLDYIFSKRFNSGYIFFKILLKREATISVAGHITFVLQEESFSCIDTIIANRPDRIQKSPFYAAKGD